MISLPSRECSVDRAAPGTAGRARGPRPGQAVAIGCLLCGFAWSGGPGCGGDSATVGPDGTGDEPCATEGERRDCYPAEPTTNGIGACASGVSTCHDGRWGDCVGAIVPVAESCNSTDDDCNGMVDEGCACTSGSEQFCYGGPPSTRGVGRCKDGTQRCVGETWLALCEQEVVPGAEQCNQIDDDCNGMVDDIDCSCVAGDTEPCYSGPPDTEGVGVCQGGTRGCDDGTWGACEGERLPASTDSCGNGLDDDCDGEADEDCATGRCADLFEDVPFSHWAYDDIMALYYHEVTDGCSSDPLRFCPELGATRAQLAKLVILGMGEVGSSAGIDAYFDDLTDPSTAPHVNRLFELGITSGCGTRLYCPTLIATREQAAVFVVRALGESSSTAAADAYFADLGDSLFPGYINRLWELGVTEGCGQNGSGEPLFCPDADLIRAAAASLVARAWDYTTAICD